MHGRVNADITAVDFAIPHDPSLTKVTRKKACRSDVSSAEAEISQKWLKHSPDENWVAALPTSPSDTGAHQKLLAAFYNMWYQKQHTHVCNQIFETLEIHPGIRC